MILDPSELRMLAREMDSPSCEMFEFRLQELYDSRTVNEFNVLLIPRFWSETVFDGLRDMVKEFPNLKFGSIVETSGRLRITTIPATGPIEVMKLKLYNKIDTLVLETIDHLLKGDKKPFFMT